MNFNLREASVTLQVKLPTLKRYISRKLVLAPRRSLSGQKYYTTLALRTLTQQLLVLGAKNQKYFERWRREKND